MDQQFVDLPGAHACAVTFGVQADPTAQQLIPISAVIGGFLAYA